MKAVSHTPVSSQTKTHQAANDGGKTRSGTAGQPKKIEVSQREIPIRRGPEALRRCEVGITTLLLLADS